MTQFTKDQRDAIVESHRLVRLAFKDAETAVRKRGDDAMIEVVHTHALANELINTLRKHIGLLP